MSASPTTLDEWLRRLESLHPTTIELGLDRIRQVATRLLNIDTLPPAITVTGTNGKGSTVMSMEVVALAHGQQVGTYLSPHLLRYNERVRIDGCAVTDSALIESFKAVEAARAEVSLTYFEFGTLSALWLFSRANLSLLLLEVGLGGRLDAVNIVDPRVAVITSIALDHQDWLGDTREQVGYEKAGIRRAGVPVVCGDRLPPPNIAQLCTESRSTLYLLGRDFDAVVLPADSKTIGSKTSSSKTTDSKTIGNALSHWQVPDNALLPGNMACALQALSLAQVFKLNVPVAFAALAALVVPGRRQRLQQSPPVYVDVAHNPHAAASLRDWIMQTHTLRSGRVIALVGMLSDKDYIGTLDAMIGCIDLWQPVSLPGPRGLAGGALADALHDRGAKTLPPQTSPVAGLCKILEQVQNGDTIIGFGSFYTVSDLLSFYARGHHGN